MSESLTPYPAYKDSGVPWLGQVPAHWKASPGFSMFREKQEKNTGLIENQVLSLSYGKIIIKSEDKLHGLVPESFETYQIVNPGDIIIRPTDLQNDKVSLRTGIAKDRGIITSAYMCLKTSELATPEYGHLLLHTYDLMKIFYGMGSGLRQNLSFTDFKRMPVFVPPLPEQRAIARFLAHYDGLIQRYLDAQERLIALLQEQKQALIQQAVTRGLNPDAPMKDSGISWLGEIPRHWEVLPLKRWVRTKITDGPHETPTFVDEGVAFMSAESMVNGKFDFNHMRGYITPELHEQYCQKCRPQLGDIFMCKSGATTGKVAIVETSREFSVWSPLALIRCDESRVNGRLLYYILQSMYVQKQVQLTWSAGTQPNLSMGAMERLNVAIPPLSEQSRILESIEHYMALFDKNMGNAQRQIELIKEYRTRLIADVVTGKLDVRGVDL